MGFNEDMQRLAAIIEEVESEDVAMERSLELFEEGVGLIRKSRDFLLLAKRKLTLLEDDREVEWDVERDGAEDK